MRFYVNKIPTNLSTAQLGNVVYFALSTWMTVVRWRHTMGIKRMCSDTDGTKLVLIDDHNQGHVFLPVRTLGNQPASVY